MSKESDMLKAVFGGVPIPAAPASPPVPAPTPQPVETRDVIPPEVAAKARGMLYGTNPAPAPANMVGKGQAQAMKKTGGWGQT